MVLRTVRYDDRRSILTAWSAERGRVSFVISDGSSREARRRRALLMPMSLFEGVADIRPGRDIFNLREVRPLHVSVELSMHPAKSVVSLFLAEVLERLLREAQPDPYLSAFIFDSVVCLDGMRRAAGIANFPLVFLYRLGHFAGIEPDVATWSEGAYFDPVSAVFTRTMPSSGEALSPEQAVWVRTLSRLTYASASRLHIPRAVRREILAGVLRYYTLHHTPLSDLKSLPVVSEIF